MNCFDMLLSDGGASQSRANENGRRGVEQWVQRVVSGEADQHTCSPSTGRACPISVGCQDVTGEQCATREQDSW